jgi:predicted DNA-binding transcriptional regulator AlpA
MPQSARTENTIPHHSSCDWCGILFTPRVVAGPKRGRFCTRKHKDRWWNRRRKQSPPTAATETAGDAIEEEMKATHRIIIIRSYGKTLAFTAEQIARAERLADELGAMSEILAGLQDDKNLSTSEVTRYCGISRSRIYQLLEVGRFPPAILLPPIGRKRVAWRSSDIVRWLRQRQAGGK